jgi:hypothetical protein
MKYQIIYILFVITITTCTITLNKVNVGSCSNSVYTFTITGKSDLAITASNAKVTLSSPSGVTPTCNIAAASLTEESEEEGEEGEAEQGGNQPSNPTTPTTNEEEEEEEEEESAQLRNLISSATATITCTISTTLSSATITVSKVMIGETEASLSSSTLSMTGTATCPTGDDKGNFGKFTLVNPYIMIMLCIAF